jgi:hypothetical protein
MKYINPTNRIIDITFKEIQDFESGTVNLGNKTFSQHQTLNEIITHRNSGFLMPYGDGIDPREFYDIGSSMISTRVVNTDLDTNHFEVTVDNPNHAGKAFLAKSLFRHFLRQTNHGEKINDLMEEGHDLGNLVVRKVNNSYSSGEIYAPVLLSNLYVIDQTAKTLEDTVVIEKQIMNQTTLRKMKDWKNIDKVVALGNMGKDDDLPYYEVYYRYGELSKANLKYIQSELTGDKYEVKEEDGHEYVEALTIVVKAKKGKKWEDINYDLQGIVVLAEELKPENIKISKELEITKYKPYEEFHLGTYEGTWLRKGARQILIPYQNNANNLKNRFREVLEQASKFVYWSNDQKIATKNVLSAVKTGQVINAEHLAVLNNQFPNLVLFSNEWNSNLEDAQRALKAFEVASGESLPSSTSATAVSVQNQQIGKYYDYIRERFGLFFSSVFKRFVIPDLLAKTSLLEKLEIVGDPEYLEEYAMAMSKGQLISMMPKIAISGGIITAEQFNQIVELKKQEILKNTKQFLQLEKDFFKEVELYIGLNPTGELYNKQARVSNGLQLVQYVTEPEARAKLVSDIANELGFKINPKAFAPVQQEQPSMSPNNLPMKEQPEEPNGGSML